MTVFLLMINRICLIYIFLFLVNFNTSILETVSISVGQTAEAATFYKYTDKKGTVVFTEDPNSIPPELRKSAERIDLPDSKEKSENIVSGRKDNETQVEKQIRRGRDYISPYLKDQRFLVGGYVVGGILLYLTFSFILKRFIGSFLSRILLKLILMAALGSGAYILYMSWLSRNILDMGGNSTKGAFNQIKSGNIITTPGQIVDRTKEIVDQLNSKIEEQEDVIKDLDRR